jgi:hypothetical protein
MKNHSGHKKERSSTKTTNGHRSDLKSCVQLDCTVSIRSENIGPYTVKLSDELP